MCVVVAPIAKVFRCFDLPGTSRGDLTLLPDGKRLAFSERRLDQGNTLYDFVSLDLASGQSQVLVEDVTQPRWLGDQAVFMRAPVKTGDWYTWKQRLFIKGAAVSPEGEEVPRYVIDRASGTVYFSTYRYNTDEKDAAKRIKHVLYKVAPGSATPEKVRDGVAPHAVVDGGKALLVSVTSDEKRPLAKLPLGGGEPTVLVAGGVIDDAVIGDKLVFLPNIEKGQTPALMVMPIAGGAASSLPGATPNSRLLGDREHVLVIDRVVGATETRVSRTDGVAPLAPLALVAQVDIAAAVMLPDHVTLAAVVVHDTNSDGKFDYSDEGDICLIPTSPTPQKLVAPTRKVPKRFAAVWPQVEALAKELGGNPRYLDEATAISIESDGEGPATLDDLARRVSELGTKLGALVKEPMVGVVVRWKANARVAALTWVADQKKLVARVGGHGALVPSRDGNPLAAIARYSQKVDFMKLKEGSLLGRSIERGKLQPPR